MRIRVVLKNFTKTIFSLVAGVLLTLLLIQNDQSVHKIVKQKLHPFFSNIFSANFIFDIENIDLFSPSIKLKNILTRPHKGHDWYWSCDSLSIGCSWLDVLLYGTIALRLKFCGVQGLTLLDDDGFALWRHIEAIGEGGQSIIPIYVQSMDIDQVHLRVIEPLAEVVFDSEFGVLTRNLGNNFKSTIRFVDGSVLVQGVTLFKNLSGPIRCDALSQPGISGFSTRIYCSICLPHLKNSVCHVYGLWRYDHGLFSLKNDDRSFVVTPIKFYTVGKNLFCDFGAHFPASYLYNFLSSQKGKPSLDHCAVSGRCSLNTNIDFNGASYIRSTLASGPILYGTVPIVSSSKVSFKRESDQWKGSFIFSVDKKKELAGIFAWNEKVKAGSLDCANNTSVTASSISYWSILPNDFSAQIKYKKDGSILCRYGCLVTNEKVGSIFNCSGDVSWLNGIVSINSNLGSNKFSLSGQIYPSLKLDSCLCLGSDGKTIACLRSKKSKSKDLVGTMSVPFIRSIIEKFFGYDLQGQGTIDVQSSFQDGIILTKLRLIDGTIRIPGTYNFINKFKANFFVDPEAQSIKMRDVFCSLYRGTIKCTSAIFHFDKQYDFVFAHAPFVFNDCLLNWQKDLFAVISGHFLFEKKNKGPSKLRGQIFIDRSQLRRNIFSQKLQKQFFKSSGASVEGAGDDPFLDIHVKTREPVRVRTSFLESSVGINCLISGTLMSPDLEGNFSLRSGSLAFPYRPLHITKGEIGFSSGQLDDPTIEIRAKNKLKKYCVELYVSGSLKEQQIRLESSPPLTEEQIVSLLLVGSEQETLNIVAPALIMQNIKGILFGFDQTTSGVQSAFARLFKPFERIHLVPSFTDQTGRGGLRGALEIDVSERWRALIQKNFSLTEDTRFELEYILSDDVSVRGVRNERGDISAQVEMRCKF